MNIKKADVQKLDTLTPAKRGKISSIEYERDRFGFAGRLFIKFKAYRDRVKIVIRLDQ